MESAVWVQRPARPCDRAHTPSHGEDVRRLECVHTSKMETPQENVSSSQAQRRDCHYLSHSQWCETPKLIKKDACLRRRLLTSRSMTDVRTSVSRTPSCRDTCTQGLESPDVLLSGPLSYSTLRPDAASASCMKRRLVFSQMITSTLEDGRDGASPPLSEPDLDETIISGLLPSETPELLRRRDGSWTPVTRLAADLSESLSVLSTPSCTPFSGLDASEDSGFGSLRLDGSEDGGYDGSFQEGALRGALGRERHHSRLERQRRLSTLREGSQSDDEIKGQRLSARGLKSEEEVFAEAPPLKTRQPDLSLTPALQAMETLSRSFTLPHDLDRQTGARLNPAHRHQQPITTRLPLSHLIGRKMGLGKMDVLTELHARNLHHVLSFILQLLSARDVHMCSQVCDSWSEIILQDRKASRRRRMYEREQKHTLEMGGAARVVDAETRLALSCRPALGSVQAQAKTPSARAHTPGSGGMRAHTPASGGTRTHTPASSGPRTHTPAFRSVRAHTPASGVPCTHTPAPGGVPAHTPAPGGVPAHTPPSTKRQQFLQVAKTLFSDECLRPCPRCEHPARCHSVKAEGVCSWSECVFHFCTSCLRAYHGSADCTRLPNTHTRRKGRSQLLPGSTQSKRNVKRL
ncbi:F-box only protein 43 isoform 2-T3 [Clarias gariepinus]|nr:F-box only protein 43 isoform X2 [Clarias gariepinus]XP_053351019.1 F-box only protein 43 isoform X2 [Clarias gariepinus]